MISGIQSSQNNDWLRKKLLERQSQKEVQTSNQQTNSNSVQNIQPQEQKNGVNQTQNANKVDSPPWGNFMQSMGLSPQGSKEADFSAIGEKLSQLKNQATDPAQKIQVDNLQQQYDGYKAVAANMPAPPQAAQNQISATPPDQMVGATQLGEYNKFLIKKRQPNELQ